MTGRGRQIFGINVVMIFFLFIISTTCSGKSLGGIRIVPPQKIVSPIAWFVLDQSHTLIYQQNEKLKRYTESKTKVSLPPWMSSPHFAKELCQKSCSQHGKRYIYQTISESNSSEWRVSFFQNKLGWDSYRLPIDTKLQKPTKICLSANGELLVHTAINKQSEVNVFYVSVSKKNVDSLWSQSSSDFYLGCTVVSYGDSQGSVIFVSAKKAVFLDVKTGLTQQIFSYSQKIQNEIMSGAIGKNREISMEVAPYANGMAVIKRHSNGTQIEIRQVRTGKLLYRLVNVPKKVAQVKFSWNGQKLAVSGQDGSIWVYTIL